MTIKGKGPAADRAVDGMYSRNDRSPNSHRWVALVKDAPRGTAALARGLEVPFDLLGVVRLWSASARCETDRATARFFVVAVFFRGLGLAGAVDICMTFHKPEKADAAFLRICFLAAERLRLNGLYI